MVFAFNERYISLLTDFGFKRVFGTEANKQFTIDFLNTLLPEHHQIEDLTFKNNEKLGLTERERRAIFDIFCQGRNGDQFIVEMQRTKQAFFRDRSVYYASFPMQELATKGDWDYQLPAIYTVSVLDFIITSDKANTDFIHTVELKDQNNNCFYDKLTFVYVELPKFRKTIDQLFSHVDKWLYLFRHLPELSDQPQPLQEPVFDQLFEIAEIAKFPEQEQDIYQDALKAYRDFNNVMNTAIQEANEKGLEKGRQQGREEGERSLILRLLARQFGVLPEAIVSQLNVLSVDKLDELSEVLLDFNGVDDLNQWLFGQQ